MKIAAVVLLVLFVSTTSAAAQVPVGDRDADGSLSILKSAGRLAASMPLQPATQRVVTSGRALFWAGLAVAAGGGVLAALSNSALAKTERYDSCFNGDCFSGTYTEMNRAALWAGIGAAGAGITMAIIGRRQQSRQAITSVVPVPGGVAVFRRIGF